MKIYIFKRKIPFSFRNTQSAFRIRLPFFSVTSESSVAEIH